MPDEGGDSVAINFVGPLLLDNSFNMICLMTDHLGSDIQLIPTVTTLTAEQMALSLPQVCFNMLNTVNASMAFSGFQLKIGHSPRLILPILNLLLMELGDTKEAVNTASLIEQITVNVQDAKDTLTAAKISQAYYANAHRGVEDVFVVGDLVMLSMFNCQHKYKKKGELRVVKFFPQWDSPYQVTKAFPKSSSYVLDMQNAPQECASYHTSELK